MKRHIIILASIILCLAVPALAQSPSVTAVMSISPLEQLEPGVLVVLDVPSIGITTIHIINEGSAVEAIWYDFDHDEAMQGWFVDIPPTSGEPFSYTLQPGTQLSFCGRCEPWSVPHPAEFDVSYIVGWIAPGTHQTVRVVPIGDQIHGTPRPR